MRKKFPLLVCSACILTVAAVVAQQPAGPVAATPPATAAEPASPQLAAPAQAPATPAPPSEAPAPIEPPVNGPACPEWRPAPAPALLRLPVTSWRPQSGPAGVPGVSGTIPAVGTVPPRLGRCRGHALNEFQGDDVAQVLRLLARQCKISLVVSDRISDAQPPMKVTMRLEDKIAPRGHQNHRFRQGALPLAERRRLLREDQGGKGAEPTDPAFYTFSYASAEKVLPLLAAQLESKAAPQFDPRTNTVFYREVGSNLDAIKLFLSTIDQPTKQVMIEARPVEVTANPQQSYGFNWGRCRWQCRFSANLSLTAAPPAPQIPSISRLIPQQGRSHLFPCLHTLTHCKRQQRRLLSQ